MNVGDIKYTDEQLKILAGMIDQAKVFTDHLNHIMVNHGLDRVEGAGLLIEIDPKYDHSRCRIEFGKDESDAGYIELLRGKNEDEYEPYGTNSPEYEYLFAKPSLKERMRKIIADKRPLPPDGLWVGDSRNDPPVDSGEWDLNDSLS